MQTVKILSDSTCDLSEELKERFNIGIVPLHVVLGEDIYEDGINITSEDIYAWAEANNDTPKTAAPSPEEIRQIFEPELEKYDEIVCFSISASMSASNSNMHLAAREMGAEDRIHVIDSANLSGGVGLMAIEAAVMAADGADGKAIVEHVEKLVPLMRSTFVVDTLLYLYRGGRCSGLTALVGGTLHIHPKISVIDGEMGAGKKYRGRIERVIMNYVHDLEKELMSARPERVYITHTLSDESIVDEACEYLRGLGHFGEICVVQAGGVVTSHCGPGTLGVFFIAQDPDE